MLVTCTCLCSCCFAGLPMLDGMPQVSFRATFVTDLLEYSNLDK